MKILYNYNLFICKTLYSDRICFNRKLLILKIRKIYFNYLGLRYISGILELNIL